MVNEVSLSKNSLERWCNDLGGEFYEYEHSIQTGYFGCDIDGDHKFEVEKRSSRPNLVSFKGPGINMDLGQARDADVGDGDDRYWVSTTEGIVGVDMYEGKLFENAPRASKLAEGRKREEESTMY